MTRRGKTTTPVGVAEVATGIDILRVRRALDKGLWKPPEQFGPDGWHMVRRDGSGSIIITASAHDGAEWTHASIAWVDHMPSYEDVKALYEAVFSDGYAYMVFPPPEEHVNIHNFALHLWGRQDGKPALPKFAEIIDGQLSI
jgi:hypothetical protein